MKAFRSVESPASAISSRRKAPLRSPEKGSPVAGVLGAIDGIDACVRRLEKAFRGAEESRGAFGLPDAPGHRRQPCEGESDLPTVAFLLAQRQTLLEERCRPLSVAPILGH